MTISRALYGFITRTLEPFALKLLEDRVRKGKERPERLGERFGVTSIARPPGILLWMHGASVGESRLLLDLLAALRARHPHIGCVMTTQTLTSADMIAAARPPGVIHQMAPLDGPKAARRFLNHWRPDMAAFAEGEIWPNLLGILADHKVPAALVNARMTARTLQRWGNKRKAAHEVFDAFDFIGAADMATADSLARILERRIDVVGNLKRAAAITAPDPAKVAQVRAALGGRPLLLAASTHPGEDKLALDAFADTRLTERRALLMIAPRHPDRGPAIVGLCTQRGLFARLRSIDPSLSGEGCDVIVADTMGELMTWYAASDAIFLAGASAREIGGHNPIEPVFLGKPVFTGPHGYNFRDVFNDLEAAGAVTIGVDAQELAAWWIEQLSGHARPMNAEAIEAFFANSRAPFDRTLDALSALLPLETRHA